MSRFDAWWFKCLKVVVCSPSLILLTFVVQSVGLRAQDVRADDIRAALAHTQSFLRDYQLSYKLSRKWMYKTVKSTSEVALRKTAPKVVGFEKKTAEEKRKSMTSFVRWKARGSLFSYSREVSDETSSSSPSYSESHAFDGKRHLHLNNHRGLLAGVVDPASAPEQGLPTDLLHPGHFFSRLQHASLLSLLDETTVTVAESAETIDGVPCYLIECSVAEGDLTARLWLSPKHGYRPKKMVRYLPNGAYCSYEVEEMQEIEPRLWFPLKGSEKWYVHPPDGSSVVLYSVVSFEVDQESLRVNSGLDDSSFSLEFPRGTRVHDRIIGESRTIGAEGKDAIDSAVSQLLEVSESLEQTETDGALKRPKSETPPLPPQNDYQPTAESSQGHPWLLLLSALLLGGILAAVVSFWKKRTPHQ